MIILGDPFWGPYGAHFEANLEGHLEGHCIAMHWRKTQKFAGLCCLDCHVFGRNEFLGCLDFVCSDGICLDFGCTELFWFDCSDVFWLQ